jgi:hypothetical protein
MKSDTDRGTRLAGVFIFLLGAGLGCWQIVLPILAALRHAPDISYTTEAVALAPLAMLLGLFMALAGPKAKRALSGPPSTGIIVVILLLVALLTLGSIFGMEVIMKSLGYS